MATLPGGNPIVEFWHLDHPPTAHRASSSVRFSIASQVILAGGSTHDWNQEYYFCVLLHKLSSRQWARKTLARKRCQLFWKFFPAVKVTDTLLIMGAVFHRNRNPGFVLSSALVAGYKDDVLSP